MSRRTGGSIDHVAIVLCAAAAGVAFDRAFPLHLLVPVVLCAAVLPAFLMRRPTVRVVAHMVSLAWLFVLVSRSALALLAITLPAPPDPWLMAVPAGLTWIGAATGLELALHTPRSGRLATLLPIAPAWVYGALLGPYTRLNTLLAIVAACCVAVQLLPAISLRAMPGAGRRKGSPGGRAEPEPSGRRWARLAVASVSLAVVAVTAGVAVPAATAAVGPRARVDPRDALGSVGLPPSTANPIDWVDVWLTHPDTLLFAGTADAPVTYWRLVVLPTYDGQQWLPPQRYMRAGRGVPETDGPLRGSVTQTVTVDTLAGPFMPAVDRPTRIGPPVDAVDVESGVLITDAPLHPGRRYTVASANPPPIGDDTCGPGSPQSVPPQLAPALDQLAGGPCTGGFAAFASALEHRLNTGRINAAGVPSAGTDLAVLAAFLDAGHRDQPHGTIVEFAAAFALAVRAAGIPSRLVVGFAGGDGSDVHGRDVRLWVEVRLPGHGWVAYHPTPPPSMRQQQRTTSPIPTTTPNDVAPQPEPDPGLTSVATSHRVAAAAPALLGLAGAAVVGYLALVTLAPVLRRSRRRRRGSRRERAVAAWHDTLDELDRRMAYGALRTATPESTRLVLRTLRPEADAGRLTTIVARALFTSAEPGDQELGDAWRAARTVRRDLRGRDRWTVRLGRRLSWTNVRPRRSWR